MSNSNKSKKDIADRAEHLSDKDLFRKIITSQYAKEGSVAMFATSRDLQYRYRDMCTVSVSTVADVMQELDFELRFIEGMPYWAMFELNE